MSRRRGRRGRPVAAPGRRRRRAAAALGLLALVVGLAGSVRRTAEGTRLSRSLADLAQEERVIRAQIADEVVRVDSLAGRDRITRAAAELGFRVPEDHEIAFLSDVTDEEGP